MSTSTSFDGKYELLGKIAEGGMGAIYKARHRLLDEIRVIKVMRPQMAESEDQRKRFLREARTATRLKHPNIVAFYDFALDATGTAYMVMEFVDGVNLSELIRKQGTIPLPIALQLSVQCLSALAYLHRRGIVHRDISPDNILMARDDEGGLQAKLIDLGIVKVGGGGETLTAGDEFIGKLRYCSPEQLKVTGPSTVIDGRSDLYSFGIVAYEMLTGICPFNQEGIHSVVAAHVNGVTLPFEEVDPQGRIPPSLRKALSRALDPDPEKRFQSAEEFSEEFSRILAAEPYRTEPAVVRTFVERALALRARPVATELDPTIATGERSPSAAAEWIALQGAGLIAAQPSVSTRPSQERTRVQREGRAPAEAALPGRAGPAPRRAGMWLAAIGVAAAAVLAGWLLMRRAPAEPKESSLAVSQRTAPTEVPVAGGAPAAPVQIQPTAAAAALTTESVGVEPTMPAAAPPQRRPRSAAPPASAPASAPAVPGRTGGEAVAGREAVRYCSTVEPTSYAQAAVKEAPVGFASDAGQVFRGPRPDAARISIEVEVRPARPGEGQPFQLTARLVNGGDMSITLTRIEESAVRSRAGFVAASGTAVPVTVEVGGALGIYRYSGVLTEGNVFLKDLRVFDSVGDSWKTSIRLSPCPD